MVLGLLTFGMRQIRVLFKSGYFPSQENVLKAKSDGMSNNVPKPLEEDGVEAIQSGSFIRLKREDSPFYFTIRDLPLDCLEDMRV